MEGKISCEPKQKNRHTERADVCSGQCELRHPRSPQKENCLTRESICEEWEKQHAERIHRPCSTQVPMQKLVNGSQRAASRAIQSGQVAERTWWEERGRGWIESSQQDDRPQKQNQGSGSDNSSAATQHPPAISCAGC